MSGYKSIYFDSFKGFIVSEKSASCSSLFQIVARVDPRVNKAQIKEAFEFLFDVAVTRVSTLNVSGKTKRFARFSGRRSDWKKAYILIKNDERGRNFMERNDGTA